MCARCTCKLLAHKLALSDRLFVSLLACRLLGASAGSDRATSAHYRAKRSIKVQVENTQLDGCQIGPDPALLVYPVR